MSGASVGCSQPAPCPGMTPLRRCRNRGEKKNIVFIDLDSESFDNVIMVDVPEPSDSFDNVIIIDVPEPSESTGVICLDDDENTDHNCANFNSGASSSTRSRTKSGGLGKSSDTVGDECQFIRENVRPVKLSKCKQTDSGKTSARNRYGIHTDSVSCPSGSDYADCELHENFFDRVREQCEKASSRRKCDTRNGQSGVGVPDSIFNDASQNVDGANDCGQQKEHLFEGKNGEGKEAPASSVSKEKGNVDFNYNYGGLGKSSDAVGDDCQFIRENVRPVKLSKCKRTYSGKTSVGNRYGISTDFGSCPSDSDCADCELLENFLDRVGNQCEKASSRRKCDARNVQSGIGEPDSIFSDARQNVDGANDCGQRKEPLFEGKNGEGKEAPAASVSKENGNVDFNYNYGKQTCNEDDDYGLESILRRHFLPDKDDPLYRMNPFAKRPSWDHAEHLSGRQFERGGSSACRDEQRPKGPSSFTCQEQNTFQVNHAEKDFQGRQRSPPGEPCLSKEKLYAAKAYLSEPYTSDSKDSVNNERVVAKCSSEDGEKVYQETASTFNPYFQWNRYQKFNTAKEKFASGQASSLKSGSSCKHIDNSSSPNNGKDEFVPGSTSRCKSSLSGVDSIDVKVCYPDNFENGHKNPLVSNGYTDDVQTGAVKSMGDNQQEDQRDDLEQRKMAEPLPNVEDCIISEREKLKETEEYKRAIEEEMASRQRALQIQAEEAQQLRRLRKRLKAENMRLLDMERRQKQRVEEIRETQKKDEENMNLKEVIRAQVIKELHQLEARCHDMASLLRGLGTFVSNSVNPSRNEVRSAYKRALLTFHPDRASRSDIRQQVEAEEKFKLISRMKEKLLLT